ncbi:MAG: 8-oxo-dGTP diphosphatase [Rickettsiales bacterium]|jgi:8-oxo-dGTP pyrophosphatase MutT (NUDIX family)|nr:8-oxo-dGTP diphosphatase [Rickettsiales bacterium]
MRYKNVTIVCIFDDDKVLMIKKLRAMRGFSDSVDGHGKDKFNFPGGKCEINPTTGAVECFLDCACREPQEETGITPINPELVGQLQFVWPDFVLICQVFRADKFKGDLISCSDESENDWVPVDKIPYDNMWPSDKIWVPYVIERRPFHIKVWGPDDNPICEDLPMDFNIRAK